MRFDLRAIDLENLGVDLRFVTANSDEERKQCLANARLIVAAPALCDLLKLARNTVEFWTPDESVAGPGEMDMLNAWYALRDRIDCALAAATGEQA